MKTHYLLLCLLFSGICFGQTHLLEDFNGATLAFSLANPHPGNYTLNATMSELEVVANVPASNFYNFVFDNFINGPVDISAIPIVKMDIKSSTPFKLRLDLYNDSGQSTCCGCIYELPISGDNQYHTYTFDFTGVLDCNSGTPMNLSDIIVLSMFVNPYSSPFNETFYIDNVEMGGVSCDAYHNALESQLLNDFGLSGGTWVYGCNEQQKIDDFSVSGYAPSGSINVSTANISGQPFSKIIQTQTNNFDDDGWKVAIQIDNSDPISLYDNLLMSFWIRSTTAEEGNGMAGISLFKSGGYNPICDDGCEWHFPLTSEWQQFFLPLQSSSAEHGNVNAGELVFTFMVGHQLQNVELGGLALINYEDNYQVQDLPKQMYNDSYEGMEAGAAWRMEALNNIEQYRKSNLTVLVEDMNGTPVF